MNDEHPTSNIQRPKPPHPALSPAYRGEGRKRAGAGEGARISAVTDVLDGGDDAVNAGQHGFFEGVVEGDGDVVGVDVFDGGVEVVEAGFLELEHDAGAHAAVAPVFVDDDAAVG